MNYLAHFLLAGPDDELRLGALLGEVVKGRVERYSAPGTTDRLRTGIRLHRTIDSFTDAHPIVRRSKQRIVERYGRASGVVVDLFYDHVLAREWATHGVDALDTFVAGVYDTLYDHLSRVPRHARPIVHAMAQDDWLASYATVPGIARALRGLSRRSPAAVGIGTAAEELVARYDEFAADFAEFFPDLRRHAEEFVTDAR